MAQLLALNVGPRPTPDSIVPETESTSLNRPMAWLNNCCSVGLRVEKKLPAPAAPARGPGSFPCEWAGGTAKSASDITGAVRTNGSEQRRAFPAGGMSEHERSMAPPS